MTAVEIQFQYTGATSDATLQALAQVREVYGIRALSIDEAAGSLRVEFDATRLNAATVARLIRQAGLAIADPASPAIVAA